VIVATIGSMGMLIAIVSAATTVFSTGLNEHSLCFENDCLKYFTDQIDQSIQVVNGTLQLLVGLSTIGGIFVALVTYLNNVDSSALSNHLSHIEVFTGHVYREVSKHPRISATSIDPLLLYNLMFAGSLRGSVSISKSYLDALSRLNHEIDESNRICRSGAPGAFRYIDHQSRMKSALHELGITVERLPRNDFFEVERDVIDFLTKIHKSFAPAGRSPQISTPRYA
jgi:hypothetical protein